jgi:8-oxo-dGTP pyrophosphatase MutT (NUDIX family)
MLQADVLRLLNALRSDFEEENLFRRMALDFVRQNADFYDRNNPLGHLTGSAWVLDATRRKALLIHHRTLDKWFQPGGHIETPDGSLHDTSRREIREECGIDEAKMLSENIFDLDVHIIPAKGDFPEHLHYDVRFAFVLETGAAIAADLAEVKNAAWFSIEELMAKPLQQSVRRMVYKSYGL